ncbi:unnamed protein product [Linum trigynum]|uniref:Uncharacterized protein n=1 Tax=Linum trigynum TaxID=586398 RepID=A0AAV2GTC7_9ROSI
MAEVERGMHERKAELVGERDKLHEKADGLRNKSRMVSKEFKRARKSKEQYKKELKASQAAPAPLLPLTCRNLLPAIYTFLIILYF